MTPLALNNSVKVSSGALLDQNFFTVMLNLFSMSLKIFEIMDSTSDFLLRRYIQVYLEKSSTTVKKNIYVHLE